MRSKSGLRERTTAVDADDVDTDGIESPSNAPSEESSRLLPVKEHSGSNADKRFKTVFFLLCVLMLFVLEFSQYCTGPAIQEIMEDLICQQYHADHTLRRSPQPRVQDSRCKDVIVQKKLAMVQSWLTASTLVAPVLLQVPYGIIADKYGRRLVFILSVVGVSLQQAWVTLVLALPSLFSLWMICLGSAFSLIGGGGGMLVAMLYTMVADAFAPAERTSVFAHLYASFLVLSICCQITGAWLLSIDPWLPMYFGLGALFAGVLVSLLLPETLHLHRKSVHGGVGEVGANERERHDPIQSSEGNLLDQVRHSLDRTLGHVGKLFGSWNVVLVLLANIFSSLGNISFQTLLLQYLARRFHWEWTTATYFSITGSATTVIVLLVVLPGASRLLVKRAGVSAVEHDVLIGKASLIMCMLGSFLAIWAASPWLFSITLVIFCSGLGFAPLSRAILSSIVEPQAMATLNAVLSTGDAIASAAGLSFGAWLLGKTMELGIKWQGLHYLFVFSCEVLSFCFLLLLKRRSIHVDAAL